MKVLLGTAVLFVFICFIQSDGAEADMISGTARGRDAHFDVGEGNDDASWPHPDTINSFPVPDAFSNAVTEVAEEFEDGLQATRDRPRHHHRH